MSIVTFERCNCKFSIIHTTSVIKSCISRLTRPQSSVFQARAEAGKVGEAVPEKWRINGAWRKANLLDLEN